MNRLLAASLSMAGKLDESRKVMAQFRRLDPKFRMVESPASRRCAEARILHAMPAGLGWQGRRIDLVRNRCCRCEPSIHQDRRPEKATTWRQV